MVSGDQWAGAEVQAFTLFTHLIAHLSGVVDLHVLVMNEGELARRCRKAGIPTVVLDESRLSPRHLFGAIRKHMKELEPDVVHTHRQKENVLGAFANLFSVRAKCVRTVHGAPEFSPTTRQKLQIALDSFCGRYLQDSIISVSSDLARKLQQRFPRSKLHVIPNGIDPQQVRDGLTVPEFKGATSDDTRHIGIVGRLVPVKRVDLFLHMAALLLNQRPDVNWQFHVFGDGPLRDSLQSLAVTLGLGTRVRFHGHRTDVRSCMAALDAVLMPSDHEGLPMTALESLALDVPVIAHDTGGLHELLSSRPEYLVADHCPEGYAARVLELLEEPGRSASLEVKYLAATNAQSVYELYQASLNIPAASRAMQSRELLQGRGRPEKA